MSRIFKVGFENISVTAIQDLFGIYAGSVKAFEVLALTLGQITSTTVAGLRISGEILTSPVVSGSGGAAGTLYPTGIDRTAATITARTNDTVQATAAAEELVHADVYNVINGYQWKWAPGQLVILPNQAFVLSLDTAPSGTQVTNGSLTVGELF